MLATPRATVEVLKKYDFWTTKRLGQHFLVDANTVRKIADGAELSKEDVVLEIGPGIGTLTVTLAPHVKRLVCVERDPRLIPVLGDTLAEFDNIQIVPGDALDVDLEAELEGSPLPNKCVSNLPYQVATPLIARYIEHYPEIQLYVVMIQKELGDRMLASPGTKEYGAFSIKIQYFCRVEKVMAVSRHVFMPKPEVDSVVLRLIRRAEPPVAVDDEAFFFDTVRAAFGQRRKTLKKALSSGLSLPGPIVVSALDDAGIPPATRGEALSIEEFARLANALFRISKA